MCKEQNKKIGQRAHWWRPALFISATLVVLLSAGCIGIAPARVSTDGLADGLASIETTESENNAASETSTGQDEVAQEEVTSEEETPEEETTPAATETEPVETDVAAQTDGDVEQFVTVLPLPPELSRADLEISAMTWYGDHLIVVPQYPESFGNQVFAFERQQILDTLDGKRTGPLDATPIPFNSGLLRIRIPLMYQGFEAIAFIGDRVYVTVEAGRRGSEMAAYLVAGEIEPDLSEIRLDYENYVEIPNQAGIGNMSDESIIASENRLFTLYEANGVNVNPTPVAHLFGPNLEPMGTIPFPNIEYRITDATEIDQNGRFWAINYFFPGEGGDLRVPDTEPLAARFGEGASHQKLETVERLVEFQITSEGVELVDTPPIQLILLGGDLQQFSSIIGAEISRNWEGIVRLDDRGFLLATDKFPDTILGFVPFP